MDELIEALQIFKKYMDADNRWPTHCEHDELFICEVNGDVSDEDKSRLEELSFTQSDDDSWSSFRFGSC